MKIFLPTARDAEKIKAIPYLPADTIIISLNPIDVPYTTIVSQTRGYWRVLNEVLTYLPMDEPFVWLADDIKPHVDWWQTGYIGFRYYLNMLGLLAFNDLNIKDAGCAFGMTTRKWLDIVFDVPYFPHWFGHNFPDTLIADRSKDLGRYYFCEEAIVEHLHWSIGKSENDEVYKANKERAAGKDKPLKDKMDRQWKNGGFDKARWKLEVLNG